MKQETLEEVAERLQKDKYGIFISKDAEVKGQLVINTTRAAFLSGMIEGAKWQAERGYSEEDMRKAIFTSFLLGVDRGNYSKELEDKLIEKFKKK